MTVEQPEKKDPTPTKRASAPRHKMGKPASDDPVLQEWGAALAARRRALGRVQRDVAEAAGVSRSTLHTLEHGGAGVRWEKVLAVAEVLGLQVTLEDGPAAS